MVAVASAQISLTTCSRDVDCRTYEDTTAVCLSSGCDCTSPDTTDFCSANSTSTTTGVSYVYSFNFDCDKFFTNPALISRIRLSIEQTVSLGEIAIEITFSCGSVEMIVNGDIPVASVASIGADIQTSVEAAVLGTEMQGTLTASSASVDAGTTATTCNVTSPVTAAVYVDASGNCTVTACETGYDVQSSFPNYIAECVAVDVDSSDDDLSKASIAAIVIGSFAFVVLIGAAAFIMCGSKSSPPAEEENVKAENEPVDV